MFTTDILSLSSKDDYVRISKKYEEAIKHCKELTSTKCELERVKAESEILQFSIQTGKQRTQELERNVRPLQLLFVKFVRKKMT